MSRPFILLVLFLFVHQRSQAEHFSGGSITSVCTGNNFHDITLYLYLDCSGSSPGSQLLNLANDCGVVFSLTDVPLVATDEISPLCPSQLVNSTCNGGTFVGLRRYTYRTSVYLSPCDAWTISWGICCRNSSANLLGTPGIYLEEKLNNASGLCNSAPAPVQQNVPLVCVDQPVSYDASATQPDGHTLRYHLINARYAAPDPTPVFYAGGNTGAVPYTGMAIDSITGMITFLPISSGNIVTAVEVREYSSTGGLIGTVMRDFLFLSRNCSNAVPAITSGTFTAVSGPASITGPRELVVCSEGEFCGSLAFADSNVDQVLSLSSNLATNLPGATIQLSGTNPVAAQICWNSAGVPAGTYVFTITATDNACPVFGSQGFIYAITVAEPQASAGEGAIVAYCDVAGSFALIDSLGGTPAQNGTWSGPAGTTTGLFEPGSSLPGEYTYTVVDEAGCTASSTLLLNTLPSNDPFCIALALADLQGGGLQVHQDPARPTMALIIPPHSGTYLFTLFSTEGRLILEQRPALVAGEPFLLDLQQVNGNFFVLQTKDLADGRSWTTRLVLP